MNYTCNSLPRIGVCTWKSWFGKVIFFFQDLKANLSYKFRSNSYSSFRGWSLPKQGSCFPQTQLRVGGKILPNKTWVANFSFTMCFLWCIPKFGEDVSHSFSSGWFIRTHLSDMKHIQHHPTTSQVLPQAQLSDFSCPALIAVLCANWCCLPHKNGYVNEVYALHI